MQFVGSLEKDNFRIHKNNYKNELLIIISVYSYQFKIRIKIRYFLKSTLMYWLNQYSILFFMLTQNQDLNLIIN